MGYHYVSLRNLVDFCYDRYELFWIASLNFMVSNTVLEVPNFEIAHENYLSTKLHKKLFENYQ